MVQIRSQPRDYVRRDFPPRQSLCWYPRESRSFLGLSIYVWSPSPLVGRYLLWPPAIKLSGSHSAFVLEHTLLPSLLFSTNYSYLVKLVPSSPTLTPCSYYVARKRNANHLGSEHTPCFDSVAGLARSNDSSTDADICFFRLTVSSSLVLVGC